MNPRWLFPLLAVFFALAALWHAGSRRGRDPGGRARTWALLAVIFGAVSVWLHLAP